jgi:hypothetical protein
VAEELAPNVEANARLTGSTAAVLLVLLAIEGVTIFEIGRHLKLHVFVGMLIVPPALLKTATTGYRFARYYLGSPPYVRRGPPHPILRVLGPFVAILTFAVLGTGIALLYAGRTRQNTLLFLHKATFILWFAAMTVHVLGHLLDTYRLAPEDWSPRATSLPGAWLRRSTLVGSLVAGTGLGLLVLGQVDHWSR